MTKNKMNSKKQSLMRFWKMIQADHPIFYGLLLCSLIGNLLVVAMPMIMGIGIDQLLQRISEVGMMNMSLSDIKDTLLMPVSYTHLRAHETDSYLVCRLLLEKKKKPRPLDRQKSRMK